MGGTFNKKTITKTRRKTRDLDQIKADLLSPKHLEQFKALKAAEDLPGLGRHYCIECAKYFDAEFGLLEHRRGKPHKRRVKALKEEPYTQKEAEAAVGICASNALPTIRKDTEDLEMIV